MNTNRASHKFYALARQRIAYYGHRNSNSCLSATLHTLPISRDRNKWETRLKTFSVMKMIYRENNLQVENVFGNCFFLVNTNNSSTLTSSDRRYFTPFFYLHTYQHELYLHSSCLKKGR